MTACWRCNNRKSGGTPDEAGMRLMKRPVKPRWSPIVTITIGIRNTPEVGGIICIGIWSSTLTLARNHLLSRCASRLVSILLPAGFLNIS